METLTRSKMTHVLIADDETHTRLSLSFILESAGYLVTDAPDGQEALDKILALKRTSHPINLLVLDIEMPRLTGWELLDELEERNIFLPTIIITGFSDSPRMVSFPKDGLWSLLLNHLPAAFDSLCFKSLAE